MTLPNHTSDTPLKPRGGRGGEEDSNLSALPKAAKRLCYPPTGDGSRGVPGEIGRAPPQPSPFRYPSREPGLGASRGGRGQYVTAGFILAIEPPHAFTVGPKSDIHAHWGPTQHNHQHTHSKVSPLPLRVPGSGGGYGIIVGRGQGETARSVQLAAVNGRKAGEG